MAPGPPTQEELVAHEVGHLLAGDNAGRALQRIEWIAHPDGRPHARSVMSHTNWCQEQAGAEQDAQNGRLIVAVAGSVAAAALAGRELSVDLLDSGYCEDDREQAFAAARRLGELDPDRGTEDDIVLEGMRAAGDVLRSGDYPWLAGELSRRLLQLRTEKPHGLIVLDSREIDELMRRIGADWMEPLAE